MSKNQAIYGMWAEKSDDEVNKLGEFIEFFRTGCFLGFSCYYVILQIYDLIGKIASS